MVGKAVPPPVAVVGAARRCEFNEYVTVAYYSEVDNFSDAYWLEFGIEFSTSWESRSESVRKIDIPPRYDGTAKVLDDVVGLPNSAEKESRYPVSRKVITHLAHAVARMRAGLMRLHLLTCGDHPMLDGSYAVMHAQGRAEIM